MFGLKLPSNQTQVISPSLEVVGHGSETQLQVKIWII